MAERFYSSVPSTDETALYMGYNVAVQQQQQQQQLAITLGQQQQQQPLQQQQANHVVGLNVNLSQASNFFGTEINSNKSNSKMEVLRNTNINALRCFSGSGHAYSNLMSNHILPKYAIPTAHENQLLGTINSTLSGCQYAPANGNGSCYNRNRYMPYTHSRTCASNIPNAGITMGMHANYAYIQQKYAQLYQNPILCNNTNMNANNRNAITTGATAVSTTGTNSVSKDSIATSVNPSGTSVTGDNTAVTAPSTNSDINNNVGKVSVHSTAQSYANVTDPNQTVTLQITNLDYSMDEISLRNFLLNQLKPITPVVSLVFEGSSYAKVTVPDLHFAKQVVSNLHRKKIGHKRMLVSYTRDSSLTEINTLRCQVAGLLKDVPYYTLPMYKFRELFQSRFKTSISVLDLYKMQDICTINADNNEEKFITLQPELVNSLENSPLMEGLQHSVPYCTVHFKREQHKGWAEQDIEPLPNVFMTITEIQQIIYLLLKNHPGDIPVASLVHCIEAELNIEITTNENGVNLEHLICCVQGIQIQVNNFGIKILGWLELDKDGLSNITNLATERAGLYAKNSVSDPLYQISREVIELVKMSPKSTMKFNRFIPAYHNHFGKQCRVADYGYTKLIELFEALSSVVQIMGDGENRQITLTHRTQIRRFTSDLLRVLRAHGNKSVLLSQLPVIFSQTQNRNFDVTDYGVCDIVDILDGLVNSNIVVVSSVQNGKDILISMPKRKQTNVEIEKTCTFAGEMVELFRNAPQYTILFQKFVRSYHYHFAYQCRLSDYGFLKLADLMESIQGIVEMELTNDEDKKIFLSPLVARRVFAEQCEELIRCATGASKTCTKLEEVLKMHKKKYGYQIQPQTLGVKTILEAIEQLPYVEMCDKENCTWITCHSEDVIFRTQSYRACKHLLNYKIKKAPTLFSTNDDDKIKEPTEQLQSKNYSQNSIKLNDFIDEFNIKYMENITEASVKAMRHVIEIYKEDCGPCVRLTKFITFLLNIIRLLEQHNTMLLHEIKSQIDCGITSTFEFGYPNLFSILSAYPDIFSVNLGGSQERSEVSLLQNSELRLVNFSSHQHLFGSLKLPSTKLKPVRAIRPAPLGDYNSRCNSLQGPPAKTRAIAGDNATNSDVPYPSATLYRSTYKCSNSNNLNYQQPINSSKSLKLSNSMQNNFSANKSYSTLSSMHNTSNSSIYSTTSHNASNILNTSSVNSNNSNKENSFNTSLNLFNSSLNSTSNHSLSEINSSFVHIPPQTTANVVPQPLSTSTSTNSYALVNTAKLWDRRHTNYYQQHIQSQQQQSQPLTVFGSTSLSVSSAPQSAPPPAFPINFSATAANGANDQGGLHEFINNMQMGPVYQPPKPDTPPTESLPFWIDPIWSNKTNEDSLKNDLLDIKFPELKTFNMLPMLLSPYTISKNENMKQVFNFGNHDRKIA